MIIVEQGKVVDLCAEPGEYVYDFSTEPSIFTGSLSQGIKDVFKNIGKRFTFGGEPPKDQRVYYFNTKELVGNKYGTAAPVPFRVVDARIGLDVDIAVRCFGEYSYRITNPILFYTNVCGNVGDYYTRENLDSQMKAELLTALQPAFARISEMGIRYSAVPGHAQELGNILNEELSAKWRDLRGIEIVSFGVSSLKASEEDEKMIKELQRNAALRDPTMAAAHLTGATAAAMQSAAANEGAGAAMAFMGMGMAGNMGGQAANMFQMGMQQQQMNQQMGQQPTAQPWARSPRPPPDAGRSRRRRLDLPRLRHRRDHREVLPRVRRQEAGAQDPLRRQRLDLRGLRHGEQGQVLRRVRRQEARGRAQVQVRQVRLGACRSHQAAQVLPRVRRPL